VGYRAEDDRMSGCAGVTLTKPAACPRSGCGLAPLVTLDDTLDAWREEIATMWRLTRNNGITEGFCTKMEVLQRQAYSFRSFQNYSGELR